MVDVARELHREVDAGDPDEEDAGLPRPDVEAERDAGGGRVQNGAFQRLNVAVDDELPDRLFAFRDGEGDEEREDGDALEEHLGRAVVGEADERVAEERSRKEREDQGSAERGDAAGEPTCDEVRRDRDECARDWGHDEHDLFGATHDRASDPDADRHDVVPERPELAGSSADREPCVWIERQRIRPVLNEIRRLAEVIPRVVAAEVHLAVLDEVAVRPEASPQHEGHGPEEERDVVPPFEDVEGSVPSILVGVCLRAHCTW